MVFINTTLLVINVIDIETFEENENVIPYCICGIIDNKEYLFYYNNSDSDFIFLFFSEIAIQSKIDKISIYVHNINFDGPLILDTLSKKNIFFDWIIKDLNIYYISFKILDCFFEIKCSYKLIPIALKNVFDYEKSYKKFIFPYKFSKRENLFYFGECPSSIFFESKKEYDNFFSENNFFDFKKKSLEYCLNDVKIVIFLLKNILNILDKDTKNIFIKSLSSPSMSYKIFFKKFNHFKIKKCILKEDSIYIRNSYYGGRCEVFGNPKKNEFINYFDFSGMYGLCMKEKFPIGDGYFSESNKNWNKIGFHTISFKSNFDIPILPYRDKKLIFPNGTLIGTFWYEEIKMFVEEGGVVLEVFNSYLYDYEDYVFLDFVDYFNIFRDKKGYYKIFGKLMINSLYGGFAMDEDETITIITFSEEEFYLILEKTNVISWFRKNSCIIINIHKDLKSKKIFNKKEKRWSDNYSSRNVSYASIISSKARIKLFNAFNSVIKSGGRLLYCDTDSIFASFQENKKFEKMGEITWNECYTDAFFISPKFYGYIDENENKILKIKGVNYNNYDYDNIKKEFFSKKTPIIEFNNQLNFRKKELLIKQKYIKKNIQMLNYDKRIFCNEKINTTPIFLKTTL